MAELTSLRNIGSKIEKRLKSVGIATAEELRSVGSKEAFVRLKAHDPNVCATYLYTLEGAITDIDYNQLSEGVKQELKSFIDNLSCKKGKA